MLSAEKKKQDELRQADNARNTEERKRMAMEKAIADFEKAKEKSAEKAVIASKHQVEPVAAETGGGYLAAANWGSKKKKGPTGAA